jgi:hypothetical protein
MFVVAGDSRESIEISHGKSAWRFLADNGFVERTTVSSVGFYRDIDTNSLLVVFPKAFNSPLVRARLKEPSFERDQIFRLIRVFRQVRRSTNLSTHTGNTNQTMNRRGPLSDPVLDSFDAALRLRRDFAENGIYIRKANQLSRNNPSLPVNWPRTIDRSSAVLSGRDILFHSPIHNSRKRDTTHPLTLLHATCLREIFRLVGERSEIEDTLAIDSLEMRRIRTRPREYLRHLSTSVFDERGRFLIDAIGAYLADRSLLETAAPIQDDLLCFTRDFEDIWEQVLRDILAPGQLKRNLPAGEWIAWPGASSTKGMQPEFDVKIEDGDSNVLLDAKDYRILSGSKWLGSNNDHYKQIIYRHLLSAETGPNIINVLAFPTFGQGTLFGVRGCHHWKELQGSRVFEVTIDYELAIKRWLRELPIDVESALQGLLLSLRKFSAMLDATSEGGKMENGGEAPKEQK